MQLQLEMDAGDGADGLIGSDSLWGVLLGILVPAAIASVNLLFETPVAEWWNHLASNYPSVAASVLVGLVVVLMVTILWGVTKRSRVHRLAGLLVQRDQALGRIREHAYQENDALGGVWTTPVERAVEFVIPSRRRPKIVSVVNLKGGVGKTTLAANLGVVLSGRLGPEKRVLLVDLDWQGTLTELCVEPDDQVQLGSHSVGELLGERIPEPSLLRLMTARARGTRGVSVLPTTDGLDSADFRGMLRWLLGESGPHDLRHRFRAIFHDPRSPLAEYDLIVFDCPPRLSLGAVNALAASDHVLVPVNPSIKSINAAPRTLKWLWRVQNVIGVKQVQIAVNEVRLHNERPILAQQEAIANMMSTIATLQQELGAPAPTLLKATLKDSREVVPHAFDDPIPATTARGRELFEALAKELQGAWGLR